MSARLSTARPLACSGAMYAAVPRIMPIGVMAGDVMVGELASAFAEGLVAGGIHRLRQTEVQHLHRAVGADFDIGWLEVAVNDALLVRGFEGLGDLARDRQRVAERERAPSDEQQTNPRRRPAP